MNASNKSIRQFLDEDGRIAAFPAKKAVRILVLGYLAEKFETNKNYTEKQVNAICDDWHTFGDYFILRRSLIDEGFLLRENDGSCYWRNGDAQAKNAESEVTKDE